MASMEGPAGGSSAAWVHDVKVEVAALDTTGGRVWRAARELCAFLEQRSRELGLPSAGAPELAGGRRLRVLEIGAGCGWLGICLARNAPGTEVVMTEQPAGLEHLQRNIELNREAGVLALRHVSAATLDWSDCANEPLLAEEWDLVIGSDLLYAEQAVVDLPALFARLARPSTRVLYAHTLHRYDHLDVEFFKALEAAGLERREIGDVRGEDEEEFLQELFPEERPAVFEIAHREGPQRCALPRLEPMARSQRLVADPALGGVARPSPGDTPAEAPSAARSPAEVAADLGLHVLLPLGEGGSEEAEAEAKCSSLPTLRLVAVGPFGNATHPTTRLVLRWMATAAGREALRGSAVCDYGCGSGVLGIAAGMAGAARCVGIDNDLAALVASRANAEANGVAMEIHLPAAEVLDRDIDFYTRFGDWRKRVDTWQPLPASAEGGLFDVVVCNIVVGPLCRVAPTVADLCREGGLVALAGFHGSHMRRQAEAAYSPFFELEDAGAEGGWQMMLGRRRAAAAAPERAAETAAPER